MYGLLLFVNKTVVFVFGLLYCVAQFVLEYVVKNISKNKAGKLKFS